jgi:nucleotide-binding universal stress UspA family protein
MRLLTAALSRLNPSFTSTLKLSQLSRADRWFTDIKQKCSASGVLVKTGIVISTKGIEKTIIDYAGREGVGLIVIGRKGRGFTERMRGSVASHVIENSAYPVLVVK